MTKPRSRSPQSVTGDRKAFDHLLLFFALVYVVEGLGQIGGLIAQPLNNYLKASQGWTPLQITGFITLFNLPWIIKPLYGLISDFVPLFGYRRKSYLLLGQRRGHRRLHLGDATHGAGRPLHSRS